MDEYTARNLSRPRRDGAGPARWSLLVGALLLSIGSIAAAQDEPDINVRADRGGLDVRTGAYELLDNVMITRGELVVNADRALSFSDDQGEPERIELYGSPVTWRDLLEDGSEVHGESAELIYDFVRNRITMNTDARIRNPQGSFSGATLVYDLDTQNLVGDGGVNLVIRPGAGGRGGRLVPQTESEPDAEPDTDAPIEDH